MKEKERKKGRRRDETEINKNRLVKIPKSRPVNSRMHGREPVGAFKPHHRGKVGS